MNVRRITAVAAVALGTALASGASAATSSVNFESSPLGSVHKRGSYHGTATYDSDAGKLTVTITNDSPANRRGYITALAFKVRDDGFGRYVDGDDASIRRDQDAFDDLTKGKKKQLKPFKDYDAGAALDGKWKAGRARRGIASGQSRTFEFDLLGADPNANAMDLLFNTDGPSVVASFGGFKGGKRDQVGGLLTQVSAQLNSTPGGDDLRAVPTTIITPVVPGGNNGGGPVAIPLPPAAWPGLATLALLAAATLRKRLKPARAFA